MANRSRSPVKCLLGTSLQPASAGHVPARGKTRRAPVRLAVCAVAALTLTPLGCNSDDSKAPGDAASTAEQSTTSTEYPGQKYSLELGGVRFELIDPQAPLTSPPDVQLMAPAAAQYAGGYEQVKLWLIDSTLWVNGQAQGAVAEGDRVRITNRQGQLVVEKNPVSS